MTSELVGESKEQPRIMLGTRQRVHYQPRVTTQRDVCARPQTPLLISKSRSVDMSTYISENIRVAYLRILCGATMNICSHEMLPKFNCTYTCFLILLV
jgi:hypothetical protein